VLPHNIEIACYYDVTLPYGLVLALRRLTDRPDNNTLHGSTTDVQKKTCCDTTDHACFIDIDVESNRLFEHNPALQQRRSTAFDSVLTVWHFEAATATEAGDGSAASSLLKHRI